MRKTNVTWLLLMLLMLLMLLSLTAQTSRAAVTPEQHALPRTEVRSSPTITTPDKAAIGLSQQWREQLLAKGGAGLYQSLDLSALGKKAGLDRLDRSLLPRLQPLLTGETPARVRVYWVAVQHSWLARLDFAAGGVNFLKLDEQGGKLKDWYDYSLGTSLSQLLAAAAQVPQTQLSDFLERLTDDPMAALKQLDVHSPLARLVLAACLSHDCYDEALAKLPLLAQETSLFALEKAIAAKHLGLSDQQMQQLQQQLGEDPAVVWLAAGVAMTEHNWQKALAEVMPALAKWPSEPRLYPIASQCYMELKQPAKALKTLQTLVAKTGTQIDWEQLVQAPVYAPLKPLLKQQGLLL